MATVRIEYFAILRERAGRSSEQIDTSAATAADLYEELRRRYPFPQRSALKVAINDEFGDWHAKLADGDRVVFIPPVAGG